MEIGLYYMCRQSTDKEGKLMENKKSVSVNVNGNNYCFNCYSFLQEGDYPIVKKCELYLGDKKLSVGEVHFTESHLSLDSYDFETVIYSAVRNCNNAEYYRLEKEFLLSRNRQKMTPKLKKEFLEYFNNIPLIKDMSYLWNERLKTSIWK